MPISEQVMRDLRDIVRATQQDPELAATAEERLVFRVLPSLLDEVESLRDRTLQKDFLALYASARALTSAWHPAVERAALWDQVEHLGLHVRRLAPLYDDVRMQLNAQLARQAWPVDPSMLDMRLGPITRASDPAHSVRVLQSDGTGRVECDHTFKGTTRCVHCGKSFAELRAEMGAEALAATGYVERPEAERALRAGGFLALADLVRDGTPDGVELPLPPSLRELARLQVQLPDGVLHATPDELVKVVQRQLDEHEGAGILPMPALPDDEVAFPITLGPTLLPRVEALVATGRLGRDIEHVVQTLFVLGMLDAEGQDPQAHVGAPHSHVSAEALFVRFGLPHEGGAEATRQRASILRQLLLDLSEWCDEDDPLRRAFAAAIEALPR